MDCSPPGPSVHGIFQAWILEWVAVSFSTHLLIYPFPNHVDAPQSHIYFLSRKNSPKLSFSYSSQKSSSRKTELTNEWSIWGTVLPTYSSPGITQNTDFKSFSFDYLELSFSSSLLMSCLIVYWKIIRGKVLWNTVLRVIMLLLKILSSVTSLLGISANLSLCDTSLFALMPLPSHSRKRKCYYADKKPLKAHLSIPEEWEGKEQQEKASVLLKPSSPQLPSSRHLTKQDVPCTPMRES